MSNFAEKSAIVQSFMPELRRFFVKFEPVRKLYEKTKDVERLFLSFPPEEAARDPRLVFRRDRFEANWALAHYDSDHESYEADIGRVTKERLAKLSKDYRSALRDYRGGVRFSQAVIDNYRSAMKIISESIGPKDYPHDPEHDYPAALKAMLQAEKEYESPIPFATDPIPTAC